MQQAADMKTVTSYAWQCPYILHVGTSRSDDFTKKSQELVPLQKFLSGDTHSPLSNSNCRRWLTQTGIKSLFIAEVTHLGPSPRRSPKQWPIYMAG